ncbi:MAG: hypothetical protein ABIQ19_09045 [Sphingomonas sp.]
MSCRHGRQRSSRVRLKADAVVLLDRIAARLDASGLMADRLRLEIAEMRMRLAPTPGVRAPIIRTDYTRRK